MIVALIFCGMQLCGYFTLVKLHGKIIPALIPGTEESVIPTGLEAGFLLRVGLEKKLKLYVLFLGERRIRSCGVACYFSVYFCFCFKRVKNARLLLFLKKLRNLFNEKSAKN